MRKKMMERRDPMELEFLRFSGNDKNNPKERERIEKRNKQREENKPKLNLEEEKLKLFGDHFAKINKNKCKLIIEGQEMDLCEFYTTKSKEKTFQIKMIVNETIEDFVGMFKDCRNLLACPDLDTLNTSKATSFKGMFENCESLCILPKFVNWDTSNVTDMSSMFDGCKNLLFYPDLSKFNMSKVTNISGMFCNCLKIKFLPKINKWDTSKITDMKFLFKGCIRLTFIPDISVWDTSNVIDMRNLLKYARCIKMEFIQSYKY